MPTLKLPPMAQYQMDAIFCAERSSIIEATTKCGKTFGCMCWLLAEAFERGLRGHEFWWVAPVYPQAEIAFRRFKAMLGAIDPDRSKWKPNAKDLTVTLPNGSIIRHRSGDKPDNLYGEDVQAMVIDEATRLREEAWHACRTTITATRGRLRIIGNVKGRRNWAYKLAQRAKAGREGWRYGRMTADDAIEAGILKREEVEAAAEDLPEDVFRELYYAEPSDDGGNPFGLKHIAACIEPLSGEAPTVFGVDLAQSHDWTVIVGLDDEGRCSFLDRFRGDSWPMIERRILAACGSMPTLIDSTGLGKPVLDRLRDEAPNVEGQVFTGGERGSKQQMMRGLAVAIQSRAVSFPPGVVVDELEAYEHVYTQSGGVRYSAPEGMHDDCVCALALAVQMRSTYRPARAEHIGRSLASGRTRVEFGDASDGDVISAYDRAREDPDFGF